MIKAIRTNYNGKVFRSRFESDVAFLLDNLNIKWMYEPVSFLLSDGTHYNPDFFIEPQSAWLECRGYKNSKGTNQIKTFTEDLKSGKLRTQLRFFSEQFIVISREPLYINKEKTYHEIYISQCGECGKWQFNNISDNCCFCESNNYFSLSSLSITENGKIAINTIINNYDFTELNNYMLMNDWIKLIKNGG